MGVIGDPGEHIEYRGYTIVAQQVARTGAGFEVNVLSNDTALLSRLNATDTVVSGINRTEAIEAAKRRIDVILG